MSTDDEYQPIIKTISVLGATLNLVMRRAQYPQDDETRVEEKVADQFSQLATQMELLTTLYCAVDCVCECIVALFKVAMQFIKRRGESLAKLNLLSELLRAYVLYMLQISRRQMSPEITISAHCDQSDDQRVILQVRPRGCDETMHVFEQSSVYDQVLEIQSLFGARLPNDNTPILSLVRVPQYLRTYTPPLVHFIYKYVDTLSEPEPEPEPESGLDSNALALTYLQGATYKDVHVQQFVEQKSARASGGCFGHTRHQPRHPPRQSLRQLHDFYHDMLDIERWCRKRILDNACSATLSRAPSRRRQNTRAPVKKRSAPHTLRSRIQPGRKRSIRRHRAASTGGSPGGDTYASGWDSLQSNTMPAEQVAELVEVQLAHAIHTAEHSELQENYVGRKGAAEEDGWWSDAYAGEIRSPFQDDRVNVQRANPSIIKTLLEIPRDRDIFRLHSDAAPPRTSQVATSGSSAESVADTGPDASVSVPPARRGEQPNMAESIQRIQDTVRVQLDQFNKEHIAPLKEALASTTRKPTDFSSDMQFVLSCTQALQQNWRHLHGIIMNSVRQVGHTLEGIKLNQDTARQKWKRLLGKLRQRQRHQKRGGSCRRVPPLECDNERCHLSIKILNQFVLCHALLLHVLK